MSFLKNVFLGTILGNRENHVKLESDFQPLKKQQHRVSRILYFGNQWIHPHQRLPSSDRFKWLKSTFKDLRFPGRCREGAVGRALDFPCIFENVISEKRFPGDHPGESWNHAKLESDF